MKLLSAHLPLPTHWKYNKTYKPEKKEIIRKEAKAKEQTNKQTTPYSIFHYTKWEELCHLFVISPFLFYFIFFGQKKYEKQNGEKSLNKHCEHGVRKQ